MYMKYSIKTVLFMLVIVTGCTKWDDFKKYQEGGEIVYPGRGDTVIIYPGRDRAQLLWVLSADPRINKYRLYWNNRADSLDSEVPKDAIGDTLRIMVDPLKEGAYNFEIVAFDGQGNKSVPMRFNGKTFGANYESSLLNRTIGTTAYDSTMKQLTVNWNVPDTVNVSTELTYIGVDSKSKSIQVAPETAESKIGNWKPGTILSFKSSFKPTRQAIDVFEVAKYDTLSVKLK